MEEKKENNLKLISQKPTTQNANSKQFPLKNSSQRNISSNFTPQKSVLRKDIGLKSITSVKSQQPLNKTLFPLNKSFKGSLFSAGFEREPNLEKTKKWPFFRIGIALFFFIVVVALQFFLMFFLDLDKKKSIISASVLFVIFAIIVFLLVDRD